jgi:outer membrane protein
MGLLLNGGSLNFKGRVQKDNVMTIRIFIFIGSFFWSIITPCAFAINLIDVYKKALSSDPTFKAARSQWLSDREYLAIKRSALFPQLSASGSLSRSYYETNSVTSANNSNHNQQTYALKLTQSLFNFGNWANVWQAQAVAKQAEVTFLAAAEDLLLRTAKAYFSVLQSKDILSYTRANRGALENVLDQAQHTYNAGLISIVDFENARAEYDKSIAEEITAVNDLDDRLEKLNEITGIRYLSLDPVKEAFPLLSPQPADIEKWVKAAEQQNFDLAAERYAVIAARENIKIQNAGHLPTLNAAGSYTYGYNNNKNEFGSDLRNDKNASIGVELNVPLFQGGQVLASTKQANYQYQKTLSDQETKHRSTISLTRQAYLGVLSDISKIKANKQAIKSSQSSLRATKAGYEAGIRTMVDVLQAQAKLYDRQKDFAISEYDYMIQFLTLKQLAGILDENDLRQINAWLKKQKP